ncbi:FadR family transcriptional regulator [Peribacillus cavernae]|uniref:FadR family transcriptional regulator n=1 Tax=Peribacillus cavernae TaxID=1674310 RepID=A0A3S0TYR8_9BACI|nr:FadR/GntR family transcriptional regulator [Peribacillus cavernae]MDQ0216981.1 GntR family transcriptional repressor for pyruvate dehydrogenase complex [Peribacillus cavernae]RUQ30532.1 FadR family transcriptional regulator [Peribacillus cavernae]
MNVEKISTKKVSDSVGEQIEKMIESGTFQAGEKLPSVRELCDLFGVGRSAVRDAITMLKGKGTVHVKQGEGTFICEFDPTKLFNSHLLLSGSKDIKELFQVRKILETGIAEMAALNRTERDLEFMEGVLSNPSINGWESDYHFHMAIAKAAGNKILIQFVQFISTTMKKAMIDFHRYIEKNATMVKTIVEHHDRIYQSIKIGEPNKAHQSMIEHLNYVEELLQSSVLQKVSG